VATACGLQQLTSVTHSCGAPQRLLRTRAETKNPSAKDEQRGKEIVSFSLSSFVVEIGIGSLFVRFPRIGQVYAVRRSDEEPSPYDLRKHGGEWWLRWRRVEAFFTPWSVARAL